MSAVVEFAREHWGEWQQELPQPASAVALGWKRETSKATTVFLLDGHSTPVAVAKVARSAAGGDTLRSEAAAAGAIHALGSELIRDTCPRPLHLGRIGDLTVLWMTYLPGQPLLKDYLRARHVKRRSLVKQDLQLAAGWLDRLHDETCSGRLPGSEVAAQLQRSIARYRRTVSDSTKERVLLARAVEAIEAIDSVPITAVHGDFWMGNILVRDRRLSAVVDLEQSSPAGLAVRDVMKFGLSYALYLGRAGLRLPQRGRWPHLAGFLDVFTSNSWRSDEIGSFIGNRLIRLGLPASSARAWLTASLVEQALIRDTPGDDGATGYAEALQALSSIHRAPRTDTQP